MTGLFVGDESRESYEASAAVLSYRDSGKLRCGACLGECLEHYKILEILDIGNCCRREFELLAAAGVTQAEALAHLAVTR